MEDEDTHTRPEEETEELHSLDVKYRKTTENEINGCRMEKYENWESLVDDFGKTIQNSFNGLVRKLTESLNVNNFQCDALIDQQRKAEEDISEPQICPKILNEIVGLKKISKECENELQNKKNAVHSNLNPYSVLWKGFIDLSIDFFNQLRVKLCSFLRSLKTYQVLTDDKMDEKQNNKKASSKVKHLNEEIHLLETILRVHHVLAPERQTALSKNINKDRGDKDSFNLLEQDQQNRTPRNSNIITHIIDELLGRHDTGSLAFYRLPHIHQIIIDEDNGGTKKNLIINEEAQAKEAAGLYHSVWKKRIRDENFPEPSFLYDYLLETEECRIREPINYSPIFIIIETFFEEYALEWKKMKCKGVRSPTNLGQMYIPFNEKEKKEFEYYPLCHFCDKILLGTPKEEYCCTDAKLLNLIKKKVNDSSKGQVLAAWKISMLKKVAEKAENCRIKILVEEGRNFLKNTAHKMHLTYGEIAKLLLAVAIGHQRKKDGKVLENGDSESSGDDPGEGIIDKKIEPLWRKVVELVEERTQSEILDSRENLRKDISKFDEIDVSEEEEESHLGKRKQEHKAGNDGKDLAAKENREKLSLDDAEEIMTCKEKRDLRMKEKRIPSSENTKRKALNKEKTFELPENTVEEDGMKERFKRKRDSAQNQSSKHDTTGGKTKSKIHVKDNTFSDNSDDDKIPRSRTSKKKKEGTSKGSLHKSSGKIPRSPPSKKMVKNEHKTEEEYYSKEIPKNLTRMSLSLMKGKMKDGTIGKDSKTLRESKSSHVSSFSIEKQIEKTGAKIFGFIPYRLSDTKYADYGWSDLPKKYNTKNVSIYHTKQGKENIFWSIEGATQEIYVYPEGSVFCIIREDGTGEIFYPDGLPAIVIAKKDNRVVATVFSEGKGNTNPIWVVGKFDSYGHGIIYDDKGEVRMQYTQAWGRYRDFLSRKSMKWTWGIGRENNPDKRASELPKTFLESKAGNRRFPHSAEDEVPKSVSKHSYCPIPFLTVNMNKTITFRIFEQRDMCLIFNANMSCFRLELGVVVDPSEEAFSESFIDHELEKEENITLDMSSIHDELMPPPPALPENLPVAPFASYPGVQRKKGTLFLHRAVKIDEVEEKEEDQI